MKKATFVKSIEPKIPGQIVEIFKVDPSLDGNKYVCVSAVPVHTFLDAPETYIFGCNKEGVVRDWCDLPGSFRGAQDIEKALNRAGYTVFYKSEEEQKLDDIYDPENLANRIELE